MKIKTTLMTAALAASALCSFGAVAHEDKPHGMQGHDMSNMQGDMKGHSMGSMEMHKAMTDGMQMPMKMSGNVDKDFAMMMRMHHQSAIKMVDLLLEHGTNAELKAMARRMKAAQQAEIKQLAPYAK